MCIRDRRVAAGPATYPAAGRGQRARRCPGATQPGKQGTRAAGRRQPGQPDGGQGHAGQAGLPGAGPVSYTHLDVYKRQETDLLDTIKVDLPSGSSPEHRLSAYIRSHLGFNASSPQHRSIAQLEFRNLTPNQQKIIEAIRAEYTFILAEIIQHGILTQVFRPIPLQVATRLILSMLTEMSREDKSNATLTIEDSTTLLHETVLRILHT